MIRFAKKEDIPRIMDFINKYWRQNHIMSRDKALFEFQHKWEDEISFAISESNGKITGMLGYIPYGEKLRDAALAMWKINKTNDTMQGIKILTYIRENGDIANIFAPGIHPKTIPIYKFLGFETGKMKHWYRLASDTEFNIAKVTDAEIPQYYEDCKADLTHIKSFEEAKNDFGLEECLIKPNQMNKSLDFINRRYFNHPYYNYITYGLKNGDTKLFIVLRIQECNNSKALRVIDCLGDKELISDFTPQLDWLLKENGCEYADCYETGVGDEIFIKGGWKEVDGSGNIIPEYFSPFEQRNIDIYYMNEKHNAALFKGDGDMDRPN